MQKPWAEDTAALPLTAQVALGAVSKRLEQGRNDGDNSWTNTTQDHS